MMMVVVIISNGGIDMRGSGDMVKATIGVGSVVTTMVSNRISGNGYQCGGLQGLLTIRGGQDCIGGYDSGKWMENYD